MPSNVDRPVLIDENDGRCEICIAHQSGNCDRCKQSIPEYSNMGGNGYQSVRPTHFHLRKVSGIDGREARYAELCLKCYRLDFADAHPDVACPV